MTKHYIETMESRRLLSVSINSAGWTVVTPSADTRIIYVSSSTGNDKNNGLSPATAVQSIARGESLLQDHTGDWLLLKAGDTWDTGLGTWRLSGASAQDPMLVGSYGTGARPLLDTGANSGLWAAALSSPVVNDLDIIGLHFVASGRVPGATFTGPANSTGINILTQSDSITIENCQIEDYAVNINLQSFYGPITNASINRNIIDDSYAVGSHSQGLYAYGVKGLTIEGNTFNANGFNNDVPDAGATYYNHDCYISANNVGVTVDNNIFANAAGYGLQARPGGTVENNLFVNEPVGMSFGLVNGADTTTGGVTGIVNGNVFVVGGDLNGYPYGQGLVLGNTMPGDPTVVSNNIFDDGLANSPAAITLAYGIGQIDPQNSVGLNDLRIVNNVIYRWNEGVDIDGGFVYGGTGLTALNDVTIDGNDFQDVAGSVIQSQHPIEASQLHFIDNVYPTDPPVVQIGGKNMSLSQWSANETGATQANLDFADPTYSLETYDASIGGTATTTDFLAGAAAQSQANWNPAYTPAAMISYMQTGFTLASATRDWSAPTAPIVSAVSFPTTATPRDGTLTFTVTYQDQQSINVGSLSSGNLTVTAPGGYSSPATFVSATGGGTEVIGVYSIPAPLTQFIANRRLKFTISLNSDQVTDDQQYPAQAGVVGSYRLHVLPLPKPPTVQGVKLINHGQGFAVRFSEDVSASLNVADLVLTTADGQTVDPSLMTLSWNAAHDTATWAFSGEPGGYLPAGRWHVQIVGASLTNSSGELLNGNHNGVSGDNYSSPRVYATAGELGDSVSA